MYLGLGGASCLTPTPTPPTPPATPQEPRTSLEQMMYLGLGGRCGEGAGELLDVRPRRRRGDARADISSRWGGGGGGAGQGGGGDCQGAKGF
jgi:hypothetical protein